MPNDVWEEISQDIPSMTDPFLQQYMAGRTNLISQERTKRSDAAFRQSLSPIAKRACRIVERIREHEQQTVWTPAVEEKLASETHTTVYPGMMFSMAKERMEETKLFKIVRQMPKGSLLHSHLEAMVDFEYLIGELLKLPNVHMSSDRPLTSPEALEQCAVSFRYRAKERVEGSIWTDEYKKNKFLLLTKMADEFPNGGRDGFIKWLKGRCTLSTQDSHDQHHGIDHIWSKFKNCFVSSATVLTYEPMFRIYLRRLMSQLKADGILWVELR